VGENEDEDEGLVVKLDGKVLINRFSENDMQFCGLVFDILQIKDHV
jgi:hypothetical protein